MDNVPGVSAFRQPTTESAGRLTGIDKNTDSIHAARNGTWSDGKDLLRINCVSCLQTAAFVVIPAKAGTQEVTGSPLSRGW